MKFDLRFPIGILFSLYGAVLTIFGAVTNSRADLYQGSLGININLWWGLVLLIFGLIMLVGALRGRNKPPEA